MFFSSGHRVLQVPLNRQDISRWQKSSLQRLPPALVMVKIVGIVKIKFNEACFLGEFMQKLDFLTLDVVVMSPKHYHSAIQYLVFILY